MPVHVASEASVDKLIRRSYTERMSRMKDLLITMMESAEPGPTDSDLMQMQHDAAHNALDSLSDRLEYLEWRLTFFCDPIEVEHVEEIKERIRDLRRILA